MGWGGTQARGVGEVKVERGRRRKEKQTTLPCTNVRTVLSLSLTDMAVLSRGRAHIYTSSSSGAGQKKKGGWEK